VVETKAYLAQAKGVLSDSQRTSVVDMVARNPEIGAIIPGTGGIRKVRYANIDSKGKSGGARIAYFYHNAGIPIFLLAVFGKGQKSNLTKEEQNELRELTALLKKY